MLPMPKWVSFICGALLLIGALKMPYGYYTLLRLVCFVYFVLATIISAKNGNPHLPWILGFLGLIFNPFFKVHFEKDIWAVIDVISAFVVLYSAGKVTNNKSEC